MPAVSVIVPSYNTEKYIGECIESVLSQTLQDIELIIVDDGSTDGTFSIAKEYAERDPRVKAIQQQNQFAGVARNNGMAHATGEYLYFLDSDDFIDRDMMKSMYAAAKSCDADVVVCRSRNYSMKTGEHHAIAYALRDYKMDTPLTQEDIAKTLFRSVVGWPWDKIFKRSFILEHGLTYQPLRSTNDAFFVFMAMALAKTTYCLSKELVTHRIDDLSSISNTRKKSWNNALIAQDAIGERLRSEGIYEMFERTYVNWVVNFTRWNLNTLDDESAKGLLAAARERLEAAPLEREYYFLHEDYDFAELMHEPADSLVLRVLRAQEEVKMAKKLQQTRLYKTVSKYENQARFVWHRILKRK